MESGVLGRRAAGGVHQGEGRGSKDKNDGLERKVGGIGGTEERREEMTEKLEESEERGRERNRGITIVKGV